MPFKLMADEDVESGIRRVAYEQLDKCLDELDDASLDAHETVHQVRKRCKKLRGLLRLVRPALGYAYRVENAWYRDAAQRLAHVRDAHSMIETVDALAAHFGDLIDPKTFTALRERLSDRHAAILRDSARIDAELAAFRERMLEARERVHTWQLEESGFAAVRAGLLTTYVRGQKAMHRAYLDGGEPAFHEWRKRTKYHWYHLRLLRDLWEAPLSAVSKTADELSHLLGEDHDLALVRQWLLGQGGSEIPADEGIVQAVLGLIDRRQAELRLRAEPAGLRLYAEKAKHLDRRIQQYCRARRREQRAAPSLGEPRRSDSLRLH